MEVRLTLGEVRRTLGEVRNGSAESLGGPEWVGAPSGRSEGPLERSGGHLGRFVTGRGNHEVVQGTLGDFRDESRDPNGKSGNS